MAGSMRARYVRTNASSKAAPATISQVPLGSRFSPGPALSGLQWRRAMTTVTQVGNLNDNTLTGSPGQENDIFGDALNLSNSTGGDDTLTGGAHATNHLYGDALAMDHSTGGDDTLTGGANADNVLCGDTGDRSSNSTSEKGDMDHSTGGDDTLIG